MGISVVISDYYAENFNETIAKYESWESLGKRESTLKRSKPRLLCWVIERCKCCIKDRELWATNNSFLRFHYNYPAWVSVVGKFTNMLASR